MNIPLKAKTSIIVTGSSYPSEAVIYNETHLSDKSGQGPTVEHKYVHINLTVTAGRGLLWFIMVFLVLLLPSLMFSD